MAFISKNLCECTKSQLDLFSILPNQTPILKGQWVQYNILTNIVDSDSIEFNITASTEHYLDLAHTLINVKAKVVNENGTDCVSSILFAFCKCLLRFIKLSGG